MGSETRRDERFDRDPALGEILARIRTELVELGCCAQDLQATISAIVIRSPSPLELGSQIRLQAADALSQRLDRLAQLVGVLETQVPQDSSLDGTPKTGCDLSHALSRIGGGASIGRAPEDEGECDFFS
jgi:hypothetical protein